MSTSKEDQPAVGLKTGAKASFSKTVGESDVYLFAGITGDLSSNHVNEHQMQGTAYGGRIAHGALVVGYMSAASTKIIDANSDSAPSDATPVSLGYDRIRFLGAVRIGDTITVDYEVVAVDADKRRSQSDIKVTNQTGELVAIATHIMQWVANDP